MRRSILLLVLLLAGCGSSGGHSPESGTKPPAAFLDTASGTHKLGQASYCWHGKGVAVCGDTAAPASDGHWPRIGVTRGELARFRLGYDPEEVSLLFGRRRVPIETSRTPSWQVDRAGAFLLFTRGGGNDASYGACLVLS